MQCINIDVKYYVVTAGVTCAQAGAQGGQHIEHEAAFSGDLRNRVYDTCQQIAQLAVGG